MPTGRRYGHIASSGPVPFLGVPHGELVLRGSAGDIAWDVHVDGTPTNLYTSLRARSGSVTVLHAGFGGPALYGDELVNEWRGRENDGPYFVLARAHPSVKGLTAVTSRGSAVDLPLSQPHPSWNLRFAAGPLPRGHEPSELVLTLLDGTRIGVTTPAPPSALAAD